MRGRWFNERWQEFPSWLTSMVVHLAVFVLLGSLVTHSAHRRPVPVQLIWTFGSAPLDLEQSSPQTVNIAASPAAVAKGNPSVEGQGEALPRPSPVTLADERGEPHEEGSATAAAIVSDSPREQTPTDAPRRPREEAARPKQPAAAPQPRLEVQLATARDRQPRFDEIVDRFIAYDLGRLRGRAGQLANRRFQSLGPTAIPALVRGLNKAAGIQASCPIGVITRKLQNVISRTDDQSLIEYALQNIGRDVPRNAPYYARVQSIRRQIEVDKLATSLPYLRQIPAKYRGRWLAHFRRLVDAPAPRISRSLWSKSRVERQAAQAALAYQARPDFTFEQRFQLAESLVGQVGGSTFRSRVGIDQALAKLAAGVGRPVPVRRDLRNPAAFAQQWRGWWYQATNRVLTRELPGNEWARARELERQGKLSEAISLYRSLAGGTSSTSSIRASRRLAELADQGFDLLE